MRAFSLGYYRDPFQNISSRWTVGAGGGYYFFNEPDIEWLVAAGPGYQKTTFIDVEPGESDAEDTPAALFVTAYRQELTSSIDVSATYQLILTSKDAGRANHNAVLTLSIDLTKRLDLDLSMTWDRTEKPQADSDGVIPEKNDFRYTVGLGLDF